MDGDSSEVDASHVVKYECKLNSWLSFVILNSCILLIENGLVKLI